MALLVRGGRIITDTRDEVADILVQGETIARIAAGIDPAGLPAGTQVIDAAGKLVFPGFIDPHVHIHLPFMGTNARDDHRSASRAALVGGTTTLIEMICPGPNDLPRAAFDEWQEKAKAGCCCDWSFHQAVVRFDEPARAQLRELVAEHGVASVKVFLAYKGALDIDDPDLFELLTLARELGVIVTAHCENAEAIDRMQKRFLAEGKIGPEWHEPSRPTSVEALGVDHLTAFAGLTGAHAYIVHTSCGAALARASEARARGVQVWVEAVIPHLVLDKTWAERPAFEGAKFVMSPPLRDGAEQEALWRGLRSGEVSTVATDHAPFDFHGQKEMGRSAFTRIPNGIPSVQERADLLHTQGVMAGQIDHRTFVSALSCNAARIFGLYPRKGAIEVGSDADLVVYDPSFEGTFTKADSLSQVDYCAYEGLPRRGRAEVVTLRGRVVAERGACLAGDGGGVYLPRAPTH